MRKRNKINGRYEEDRTLYKWFLIACGFSVAFILVFIGFKNLGRMLQTTYGTYIEIHNSRAENTYNPLDKLEPVLYKVGACESDKEKKIPKQFINGKVVIGVTGDVGAMQINPYVHLKNAIAMGLDIYTWEGNIAYANYLYRLNGFTPWSSSKRCWSK